MFTALNNPSLKCFEGVVIFNYLGDTILESRIVVFMKSFKKSKILLILEASPSKRTMWIK